MEFRIDLPPPLQDDIVRERDLLNTRIRQIRNRDLIVTSVLILMASIVIALAVYWLTNSLKYAAISAVIYPSLSVVLNVLGITTNTGFRSAALQLIELNNSLIALKPLSEDNIDVRNLSAKYKEIAAYTNKVKEIGRDFINGELAMFWEWDSSTGAKTARARSYVNRARKSIQQNADGDAEEAEREDAD
ncbi:MAG: hypothetical protein HW386_510 [Gammaproteobacteria bacterium]|nr:hypothetical protein [Gammaproteobacteria bacterium]